MLVTLSKMLSFLWRIRRPMLVVLLIMCVSPIIFISMDQAKDMIQDISVTSRQFVKIKDKIVHGFNSVNTEKGCKIPRLDPFSLGTETNFAKPQYKCKSFDWVQCHKSECRLVKNVLKNVKDVTCDYSNINYVNHKNYYYSYHKSVFGEEIVKLDRSDHVKIECTGRDVHFPNVSVHWRGVKTGFRNITLTPDNNKNEPYNVVILCLESVSHNGFIRNMKKSYKYLKEKMNATILNGYNIANDGTTGALYPLFTGKSENDLKEMNEFGMRRDNPSYFIFNQLKPLGYRTAYFDDTGLISTPYQFRFTYPPADHYLRPYSLARRNGKPHRSLSHHCIESVPQYQMLMHFVKECLLLDGKKFIFSLIDDLSSENFTFVPSADDSLLDFLQTMTARRVLEDTLLIVMGDHGPRFSPIRSTHQGMLEERLPLMAIILPHKLIKARPLALKALVNNKDVLTTPLDIFTTILDVLGIDEVEPPDKLDGFDLPRALSLLGPIPDTRSCGEAGIMPHWCTCGTWTNLSKSDQFYDQVAMQLAEYINSISEEERSQCLPRYLVKIDWVVHQTGKDYQSKLYNYFEKQKLSHHHAYLGDVKTPDDYYQIRIVMDPGHAIYEGTMIYIPSKDFFMVAERDISRVNAYGDESSCISDTHPHLNKYCYCNKSVNIKKNKSKPKIDLFRIGL
ncbi:hypothetical protein HW555_012630 [Spodoptera exigua]|uniref:Uncharacterized protein n=1 Tax=Spodoptera exigua TaxID=7107 RepID=A0A835G684_SPOEX|nr:hypothetical protein HW555_012630 [Spodoptera exigua]